MRKSLIVLSLFLTFPFAHIAHASEPMATVPYVSCPADGQLGPVSPKPHKPIRIAIPIEAAAELAYYHSASDSDGLGTLAPRGWHCFGTYGSNGESLYISAEPMSTKDFFGKSPWKGTTGPGIQLSVEDGGTSGRFGVADAIVQLFPTHMQFVSDLIANEKAVGGFVPDYQKKSFPSDILHYKSNELVEFKTPANSIGIGTDKSWLKPAADPVYGMMYLGGITQPDRDVFLVQLVIRLPHALDGLRSIIILSYTENAATKLQ